VGLGQWIRLRAGSGGLVVAKPRKGVNQGLEFVARNAIILGFAGNPPLPDQL